MTLTVNAPALVLLNDQALPSRDFYLSGQCCETGWRHQGGYSERTEQSQERLQESERSLEIITVQHQDEVRAAYCRPFFTDQTAGE